MSESSPELRLEFTDAFRRRGDSVSVVTYLDNHGRPGGMTATSVTSVSADPPMLLVCVGIGDSMQKHTRQITPLVLVGAVVLGVLVGRRLARK